LALELVEQPAKDGHTPREPVEPQDQHNVDRTAAADLAEICQRSALQTASASPAASNTRTGSQPFVWTKARQRRRWTSMDTPTSACSDVESRT
jgi:hypothetical protein